MLSTSAAPGSVAAQEPGGSRQVATARALFDQGLRHVDAEEWELAAERFSKVLELRYSAVAAYNLALAHARLGKCVRALSELRELLAQPSLEPTVRDAAIALRREQEAAVGWLTVHVRGECTGCRVLLNALPAGASGTPVPVDPGHHAVALVNDHRELDAANVTVARGTRLELNLEAGGQPAGSQPTRRRDVAHVAAGGPAAPSAALAPADSAVPRRNGSVLASPWFWGGVGVLAAGVVTLGVVLSASGEAAAEPVPGDFQPSVLSGRVEP